MQAFKIKNLSAEKGLNNFGMKPSKLPAKKINSKVKKKRQLMREILIWQFITLA